MSLFDPVVRDTTVARAAQYLEISEYEFMALAHWRTFHAIARRDKLDKIFGRYLWDETKAPPWVMNLGREIVGKAEDGTLVPEEYGVRAPVPKLEHLLRMLRDCLVLLLVAAAFGYALFLVAQPGH